MHEFHPDTDFCVRCGQPGELVVADLLPCRTGPNVVAVSHILAARRLDEELQRLLGHLENDDGAA